MASLSLGPTNIRKKIIMKIIASIENMIEIIAIWNQNLSVGNYSLYLVFYLITTSMFCQKAGMH